MFWVLFNPIVRTATPAYVELPFTGQMAQQPVGIFTSHVCFWETRQLGLVFFTQAASLSLVRWRHIKFIIWNRFTMFYIFVGHFSGCLSYCLSFFLWLILGFLGFAVLDLMNLPVTLIKRTCFCDLTIETVLWVWYSFKSLTTAPTDIWSVLVVKCPHFSISFKRASLVGNFLGWQLVLADLGVSCFPDD